MAVGLQPANTFPRLFTSRKYWGYPCAHEAPLAPHFDVGAGRAFCLSERGLPHAQDSQSRAPARLQDRPSCVLGGTHQARCDETTRRQGVCVYPPPRLSVRSSLNGLSEFRLWGERPVLCPDAARNERPAKRGREHTPGNRRVGILARSGPRRATADEKRGSIGANVADWRVFLPALVFLLSLGCSMLLTAAGIFQSKSFGVFSFSASR